MNDIEKQKLTEVVMNQLGLAIGDTVNMFFDNMGFALIIFEFKRPGVGNYVSNAKREDMIKALRETADRLELKQDIPHKMPV